MPKKADKPDKMTNTKEHTEAGGRERKGFAVVLAVLILAAIIIAVVCHTNSAADEQGVSVSESTGETAGTQSTAQSTLESETAESEQAETNSSVSSSGGKTTKQAKGYSLPLSINQALNALGEHYGSGYKINSTIEEDGYNYFAIYENGEKYAGVKVDLETGKATETLTASGESTDFYLV